VYAKATMHPLLAGAALVGAALAVGGLWDLLRRGERSTRQEAR
jgi:hypothetical protein